MNGGPQLEMWYYQLYHKPRGPVTEDALHEQVRLRFLTPDALVRRAHEQDWHPYEEVFEVASPPRLDGLEEVCCFVCQKNWPRAAASLVQSRWVCAVCLPLQNPSFMPSRVWCAGNHVIMVPEADLPPRCIVCNGPVTHWIQVPIPGPAGERDSGQGAGHFLGKVLLHLFLGHAAFIAILASSGSGAKLDVGLCAQHHAQRRHRLWTSAGIFFTAVLLFAQGAARDSSIVLGMAVLLFVAGLVHAIATRLGVHVKSDGEGYLRVHGPRPKYLASLTPWVPR